MSSGMIGSSSQVRSQGCRARAARMASSTVHFMLASAMSGKPSPRCFRIACTRATSDARSGRTDLHLDGAKALGEIVVGLLQQRLHGEIEVDAAGITGHAGVKTAE